MKAASWALVVGLVLVGTVVGRGSGAGWKQVATSTPLTTRDFFGAAAYDVDATAGVLIFGGDTYTGSSTVSLGDCWAGDVGSNAWNKDPYDLPPARAYTTLVAVDQPTAAFFLFGGKAEPETFLGDLWTLSAAANWTELKPDGSTPTARYSHAAAAVPGTSVFYLFGGYVYDGVGVSNDLWMFDAATSVWTQLSANNASEASPQPPPRQAATMVGVDDGFLLFGGYDLLGGMNDLWQFSTKTSAWTCLTPNSPSNNSTQPGPRAAHGATVVNGTMYVFGGSYIPSPPNPEVFFNDLWSYDSANGWTLLVPNNDNQADNPWKRKGHQLFQAGGDLIGLFGGYGLYQGYLNDLWTYSP